MDDSCHEKIEYRGCAIEIHNDTWGENPCKSWDFLGQIICFHRKYEIGHAHNFHYPGDFKKFLAEEKPAVLMPIYAYEHGGITIKTGGTFSCAWDSGHIGWVYTTREKILKEWGCKRLTKRILDKAQSILAGEVETVDMHINGQVFGYIAKAEDGIELDSCWGYYGWPKDNPDMIESAKHAIDSYLENTWCHGAYI